MAKKVLDIAQTVMDIFYQSFKEQGEFFELSHFADMVIDERDSLLEQEFIMLKRAKGIDFVIVNPQWTARVKATVKLSDDKTQWYADVCEPLFEFPMDDIGMGIQSVAPFGQACGQFVPMQQNQNWQVCITATNTMVFYAREGCRIVLYNFDGCCKELDVLIVPSQAAFAHENQTVPDGKAAQIEELVLNKMFRNYQAKLGKIQQHNQNNPNPSGNESDAIYDNLKTK